MSKKNWSKEFLEYEDFIVNHPNYTGLPIKKGNDGTYNWVTAKDSDMGKKRIEWAYKKGDELKLPRELNNYFSTLMLLIHPTKEKPCQICGKLMSLYYIYPNTNLIKALNKEYNISPNLCDSIYEITEKLIKKGIPEKNLIKFLTNKCKLDTEKINLEETIKACEIQCRQGKSKMLGPGAMSNFPDRYDGFHTYNRCCRQKEDTGRHKENLITYSRDRRAYEYFSDGNIQAANKFMTSPFFAGESADHICPISLGFVHDPRYLQKMPAGENSAKRDKLYKKDILLAISIEEKTKQPACSWYAMFIWNYIKENINSLNDLKLTTLRNVMKQNINNYMYLLYEIKKIPNQKGVNFIKQILIKPKLEYFKYDYKFNNDGTYTTLPRNITERAANETDRIIRISLDSIEDYHNKENRQLLPNISKLEQELLTEIERYIIIDDFNSSFSLLKKIMKMIQERELNELQF